MHRFRIHGARAARAHRQGPNNGSATDTRRDDTHRRRARTVSGHVRTPIGVCSFFRESGWGSWMRLEGIACIARQLTCCFSLKGLLCLSCVAKLEIGWDGDGVGPGPRGTRLTKGDSRSSLPYCGGMSRSGLVDWLCGTPRRMDEKKKPKRTC